MSTQEEKETKKEKTFAGELLEWLYSIILALAVAIIIHAFLAQPTRVSGESMENTLYNGEYLIVSKIPHDLRQAPNYDDIVIIDSRVHRDRSIADDLTEPLLTYLSFFNKDLQGHYVWVKRVIGKGGDTITVKNGHVYRNGEELQESYIKEPMNIGMDKTFVIPDNAVFVMGDNRNHSSDSRFIGPVPIDHVLGKVVYNF